MAPDIKKMPPNKLTKQDIIDNTILISPFFSSRLKQIYPIKAKIAPIYISALGLNSLNFLNTVFVHSTKKPPDWRLIAGIRPRT